MRNCHGNLQGCVAICGTLAIQMIHPTRILLTTAFSLLSVLSAQTANIPIYYLPFPITAPGTYVVTKNLSSSETQNVAAITISTAVSGPVILDLKGFTLTGNSGGSIGIGVSAGTNVPNTNPITIRNGTLANFAFGVVATLQTDITVNNMTIHVGSSETNAVGVFFGNVTSSTISNCSFSGGSFGIEDNASPGGNNYSNDTFVKSNPLFVLSQNGGIPQVLSHCQFGGPPGN
jgi:hypothetical protein